MLCTIVGAGSGLGGSLARRFVAEGYDIALVARDAHRLDALVAGIGAAASCARFVADAGEPASLDAALAEIREWRGETNVLIYNAAQMSPDRAESLTNSALQESMAVNVGGAVHCVRDVTPGMRRRGSGTILLTGGGLALEPYPDWASLGAGKAALRSLGIGLHKRLLPDGIHVAVIAVCGIVRAGGVFDPDRVASLYWEVHRQPLDRAQREVVYLPDGADPFYNDPDGRYRSTSHPVDRGVGA